MKLLTIIFAVLLFSTSNHLFAQSDSPNSVFQSLAADEPLEITIETNLKKLIKTKSEEAYQEAELTYVQDGQKINWVVEVRPRGNLRQRVCYLPPLKIKFPKVEVAAKGWKPFHSLKLVSLCKSHQSFQDLVAKEYHAYKIYNLLTDTSFRVQLIKVHFKDSENKMKPISSVAFFIEPDKEMVERLNYKVLNSKRGSPKRLEQEAFDLFTTFQFMIGNTDWSVYSVHNLRQIYSPDSNFPIPVPYDFDNSGFVNAPYAAPHESVPIENVRQRCFMGNCRETEKYERVFQLFQDKKKVILEYLENETLLSDSSKKVAIRYLNEFYEILDNPKKTRKMILEHCDKFMLK